MKLPAHCFLASTFKSLLRLTVLLLVVSSNKTKGAVKLPPNISVPAVLIFGDSIMDTGNNNNNLVTSARCNFPPYGQDFKGGIPTGRFCNGKVPSDILVEELGIKEFLPAYLDPNLQLNELANGVCFASGGSGYDPLTSQTANLPNSRIVYFDVYNPLLDVTVNHQKYGYKVGDKGCCGTGNLEVALTCNHLDATCSNVLDYVFWDGFHPSESVYKQFVPPILQKYIHRFA